MYNKYSCLLVKLCKLYYIYRGFSMNIYVYLYVFILLVK